MVEHILESGILGSWDGPIRLALRNCTRSYSFFMWIHSQERSPSETHKWRCLGKGYSYASRLRRQTPSERGGMNVQIGKRSIRQFDITPASTEGRLQKVAAIKYESARWKAGRHVCDNYQRVTEFCTKTIFRGSRRGNTSLQW